MLQYGDRMSKAKVVGVGHAGNTFQLLEAGEPVTRGRMTEPCACAHAGGRTDLLLSKQQQEWSGGG